MKPILNYFLKNFEKKSEIEIGKAKLFVSLGLISIALMLSLVILYAIQGTYENIPVNIIILTFVVIVLFILQKGKLTLAGNFMTISLSFLVSLSSIFNLDKAPVYNYFMDEFYTLLLCNCTFCNVCFTYCFYY